MAASNSSDVLDTVQCIDGRLSNLVPSWPTLMDRTVVHDPTQYELYGIANTLIVLDYNGLGASLVSVRPAAFPPMKYRARKPSLVPTNTYQVLRRRQSSTHNMHRALMWVELPIRTKVVDSPASIPSLLG